MNPTQALPAVLDKIDADLDNSLERLFDFLKIQSISTDPAYKDQCKAAAEYVAKDLAGIGFDTSVRPTDGHPIVVGKSDAQANGKAPRVLFYGHYDVQPVDPLDLWETPPFAPRIATLPDGRKIIVARGACDDKGQVMTFVEACRAFKAVTGSLPLPITMMIEGEEECGSNHLFGFVKDNADELKLDLALVCDTSMWDEQDPDGDDLAARPGLRGGEGHLRRPRPAFRPVRRRGAESAARAGAHPRRHARQERARHHSGLLRRREGAAGRHQGRPRSGSSSRRRSFSAASASRCRRAKRTAC